MRISLYTQISPRLETFFLEEWIEHHLMIGVDKIHLYNNGFMSVDRKFGTSTTWGKKPYMNYFLEYTDVEIMNTLQDIVSSFKDQVSLVSWRTGIECGENNRMDCQRVGWKHCVKRNPSDWWIHIDPDEYILSKKYLNLKEFLSTQNTNKYSAFTMRQRLFELRDIERSTRSLTRCSSELEGVGKFCNKTLICNDIKCFHFHHPKPKHGLVKIVDPDDLMYHHHRGTWSNKISLKKLKERSKTELNETDDSMIQFLKKHGHTHKKNMN
mgnify:FL=1